MKKQFDAFISYSHAADADLARSLKDALHRFAKPWYRLRALRVFLDDANLSVTPALWGAIEGALTAADFFLLFASPAAARSEWVRREVAQWLKLGKAERLFLILTDGEMVWRDKDFDWTATTALPQELSGVFSEEPFWIDLRWTRGQKPSLADRRFRDAVADLAAPLHGVERDVIEGNDRSQHRRTLMVAWSAALMLGVLAAVAAASAVVAARQRDVAVEQAENARVRLMRHTVSNGSRLLDEGDQSGALLWFLEAARLAANHPDDERVARTRVGTTSRQQPRIARMWFDQDTPTGLGISDDGTRAAVFLKNGTARVHQLQSEGPDLVIQRSNARLLDLFVTRERVLVLSAAGSEAQIWDGQSGRDLAVVHHDGAVTDGGFNRDGKQVITAVAGGALKISDVASGRLEMALDQAVTADFIRSPTGHLLLTASEDRTVHVWNLQNRSQVAITLPELMGGWALDTEERRILTRGTDGRPLLWDAVTGKRISSLGDFESVHTAAISPDGERVAIGMSGQFLIMWGVFQAGEENSTRLDGTAIALEFSRDGKQLVTGTTGDTARVWNVNTLTQVLPSLWHEDTVNEAVFTPDGKHLLTGTVSGAIRLWDLRPSPALRLQHEARGEVRRVSFSADGKRVLSATYDDARVWTLNRDGTVAQPPQIFPPGSQLHHAALSPDGQQLVTCAEQGEAQLWDVRTGRRLRALVHARRVSHAAFSSNGRWLVTGSANQVAVWDVGSGERTALLETAQETGPVTTVAIGPQPDQILAQYFGGGLRVWDRRSGAEVLPLRRSDVNLAAIAPGGKHLALADTLQVEIIDTSTGASVAKIPGGRYRVRQISFSKDGRRLLTADEGGSARVFDAFTGRPLTPPMHHRAAILDAAFGPDDVQIATASEDGTTRLWDAATGEPASPGLVHGQPPGAIAFSPDGRLLIAASHEAAAHLWDVGPANHIDDEDLQLAELTASRRIDENGALVTLTRQELQARWSRAKALTATRRPTGPRLAPPAPSGR